MGLFGDLFSKKNSNKYSSSDKDVITSGAQRLVEIINESLVIANDSTNPETKISRLNVAKDRLFEFKELSEEYPFITITSLNEVESCIAELENEFLIAGYQDIANGNTSGDLLEKEGKVKEAIIEYEKLVNRKVDTPFTYRRLAILYRKLKNESDEIRILEEAISNIPKSNSKHYIWFQERLLKIKK